MFQSFVITIRQIQDRYKYKWWKKNTKQKQYKTFLKRLKILTYFYFDLIHFNLFLTDELLAVLHLITRVAIHFGLFGLFSWFWRFRNLLLGFLGFLPTLGGFALQGGKADFTLH